MIASIIRIARRLRRSGDGVAAIEFCLTLPILLMLTFGAYDVSRMIAARIDYQQAVTETAGLAIAQPPRSNDFGYLIAAAADAADVAPGNVAITRELRCNRVVTSAVTCPSVSDERAWYVSITINANYVPFWTHFAIRRTVPLRVSRTVRVQ